MNEPEHMLTLTHATERDVDLLIVEELSCSPAFVQGFVEDVTKSTGRPIFFTKSSVEHSKRRIFNRREIDITLRLQGISVGTILLIENKLDTSDQPRQAESYREEAEILLSRGEADAVLTVLVCPESYASSSHSFASKFDCVVTYEKMAALFQKRAEMETGEIAARLSYRNGLLHQAITKARRGYEPVPMMEIEAFNMKYIALMNQEGIQLEPGPSMRKEGRPGESKTMIFAPEALPKWTFLPQMRLVHQLREGNANINFYGWGKHFSKLAGVVGAGLVNTPYRVVPTINKRVGGNAGLMIVVDTPFINNLDSFDDQREAILTGIKATAALRDWLFDNRAMVENWASHVGKIAGQ